MPRKTTIAALVLAASTGWLAWDRWGPQADPEPGPVPGPVNPLPPSIDVPQDVSAGDQVIIKVAGDRIGLNPSLDVRPKPPSFVAFEAKDNSLIVVMQPKVNGTYWLFYVDSVDGKPRSSITEMLVGPRPPPVPPPAPDPPVPPKPEPPKPQSGLSVTVWEDTSQRTPAIAKILTSDTLRKQIVPKHHWRTFDVRDDNDEKLGFTPLIQKAGGPPVLTIQSPDGKVLFVDKMPLDEATFLDDLRKAGG